MDPGMMARHMAPIPADYQQLTNPVRPSEGSLERGEAIYEQSCAVCHGEAGWGDGPAAEGLEPPPAALAHTANMVSDPYLFYRISEGGGFPPFESAMPAFKDSMSEEERWDTVNFLRWLAERSGVRMGPSMDARSEGGMMDGGMMGGMMMTWMLILWVSLLLLAGGVSAALVLLVSRRASVSTDEERGMGEPSALEILKRRYASGELDAEQFARMKRDLEGGG